MYVFITYRRVGVLIAIGIDQWHQENLNILQYPCEGPQIGKQFVGQIENRLRGDPLPAVGGCLNIGHSAGSNPAVQGNRESSYVATLIGPAQRFVATVLRISGGQSAHEAEDLVVPGIVREEAAGLATSPSTRTIRLLAILLLALLVLPTVVILGIGAIGLKGGH